MWAKVYINTCLGCLDKLHIFILAVDLFVPSNVSFSSQNRNQILTNIFSVSFFTDCTDWLQEKLILIAILSTDVKQGIEIKSNLVLELNFPCHLYLNTDLLNLKRESVTCVFRLCTYVGLWSSNKVYL